jgi:phosphoribosyl-AMP cyclohydrolase
MTFGTRDSKHSIELGLTLAPKFDEHGLMPVMAIDAKTQKPLMLAYMNQASLQRTLELGQMVYYSRSRQEMWHKGASSGQYQRVIELRIDCDQDALIALVEQLGDGCCHTGACDCFYRRIPFGAELAALGDGPVPLIRD